jgi:rhomboid protease GluP
MQPQSPPLASAPTERIVARSQRQTMDWSLVLASQGIEHDIEHTPESVWALVVAPTDHESALAAIRQYRVENRRWPWRQPISKSGVVFDWGSAAWVLLTLVFYWLSDTHPDLREAGIMNGTAVAHGEWWRLFTATLLHADLAHLATNAIFAFILLGLAMGRYGTGVGLLAALLTGAGGNVASWLVHGDAQLSLGASGMVMGALGLVAVQSFAWLRHHPRPLKFALGGVVGGMMLFVLLGLTPGTDIVAHFGGFVAGLGLGALLTLAARLTKSPAVNLMAGLLFTTLVLGTWLQALVVHR